MKYKEGPEDALVECPHDQQNTLGTADSDTIPLSQRQPSSKVLHHNPHLRTRTPQSAILARFRSTVASALSNLFDKHSDGPFYHVHLPMLTWTDCEGGAKMFAAPTQRSNLVDKKMTDTYFGFRKWLNEILVQPESDELLQRWDTLLSPNWPRITSAYATKLLACLRAAKCNIPTARVQDVTPEEEKYLCDHSISAVFLTHFPTQIWLFQAAQAAQAAKGTSEASLSQDSPPD
ncbi:hypothetical protein ASPNIDRAFT_37982 [Aspergillus niger ATCC 1015]|uniref:Uncharacterized protein n=1 Tax=Aspergillus niger (strain ATCC 1015 / CBS 113.46 / FGSC A1144 / LSHB Ac4 / NCTC 3858a / NRRL 328 / USDA 3528.7) TaxID=380704 RepID=G3YF77_ASPNA|nr:hypothetical protein ASPNIDRAFT_37982 [Aspergillus niger ATCC 1015]